MNIHNLARARARAAAHLESIAGWNLSRDRDEQKRYQEAQRAYQVAEASFQKAIATLTVEELSSLGIAA